MVIVTGMVYRNHKVIIVVRAIALGLVTIRAIGALIMKMANLKNVILPLKVHYQTLADSSGKW